MAQFDPVKAQQFAIDTVRQLRDARFEALWAGGCVRDKLMGREPKDYDVATSATPEQIREVFGQRRTMAIGASFGVITVLGPRGAGQIDVATFRRDATYSDGRHPDHVTFSSALEDAQRRDFTINGLFYDPLQERVIDYVDGQKDLERCVVRAIGDAASRFAEDKLRILRAVRFASTLAFQIDPATLAAIRQFAPQIRVVSAERITQELRRMLVDVHRTRALELLRDAKLLHEILPEAEGVLPREEPADESAARAWDSTARVFEHLRDPPLAVVLAALLREIYLAANSDEQRVLDVCRRWRLSNEDIQAIVFCLRHEMLVRSASRSHWPRLQRVLIDSHIESLLNYAEAVSAVVDGDTAEIQYCRERLQWPNEHLNPAPLVRGDDLTAEKIPPGPIYKQLLEDVREQQLLGLLASKDEAMAWVRKQWAAYRGQ